MFTEQQQRKSSSGERTERTTARGRFFSPSRVVGRRESQAQDPGKTTASLSLDMDEDIAAYLEAQVDKKSSNPDAT